MSSEIVALQCEKDQIQIKVGLINLSTTKEKRNRVLDPSDSAMWDTSMVERTKGIKRSIHEGLVSGGGEETYRKYGPSVMRTLASQHSIMAGLGDHHPDKNGSG